jgi:hypothetical protein
MDGLGGALRVSLPSAQVRSDRHNTLQSYCRPKSETSHYVCNILPSVKTKKYVRLYLLEYCKPY